MLLWVYGREEGAERKTVTHVTVVKSVEKWPAVEAVSALVLVTREAVEFSIFVVLTFHFER